MIHEEGETMTDQIKPRKKLTPADHEALVADAIAFGLPRFKVIGRQARAFNEGIQKQVAEIKSPGMRKSALS